MPRGTRLRSIRIADPLWAEALAVANERGETLSDVIRSALQRYVRRHRGARTGRSNPDEQR